MTEAVGGRHWHRPLNIVIQGRGVRPVTFYGFDRGAHWRGLDQRAAPANQLVANAALQLVAMAGQALQLIDDLALLD